ncbi:hypothetical protein EV702DRAFT_1062383 [Suillus placidus]|uniref:Uncharacterized protein n=1 Tax=Suillus placidus TaxID=48579 RepID=A0A9P7A6R0_9AGAM|nr:hypothetical protein EV702DRAFT_1062383 [Suillus placidus]
MVSSTSSPYPAPVGGASLLLTFKGLRNTILIIGGDSLAASMAFAALEAGMQVIILTSQKPRAGEVVLLQHVGEYEVHMACKWFEEAWTMDDVEEAVQVLYR